MNRSRGLLPAGDREQGIALLDIMVGLTLMGFVTLSVMNVFLAGITQARTSGIHGEASVWVQAELDYLRSLGYDHACLAGVPAPGIATRVIAGGSGYCSGLEPVLPPGFVQAQVHLENDVGMPRVKRVTVELYRQPGNVFYRAVTYVSELQ